MVESPEISVIIESFDEFVPQDSNEVTYGKYYKRQSKYFEPIEYQGLRHNFIMVSFFLIHNINIFDILWESMVVVFFKYALEASFIQKHKQLGHSE